MKTITENEMRVLTERVCQNPHCNHPIRNHPYDLVYGDEGSEDQVYSCTVPGCECRAYEEGERQ